MNNQYQVFSGVFANERSQRFLKTMNVATDNAFGDLFGQCMPQQPKRYQECLERVPSWDQTLVIEEQNKLSRAFPDLIETFKHVYIEYVKAMVGSAKMKLLVNVPKMDQFLRTYFLNTSRNSHIRDASYFEGRSALDQRLICLDCVRDTLFQYIGEEYVKLEEHSVISETSYRGENHKRKEEEMHEKEKQNQATFVPEREPSEVSVSRSGISDVSDSKRSVPPSNVQSKVISNVLDPVAENNGSDDESELGPDDSVSNADFADKQHKAIQRFTERQQRIDEDSVLSDDRSSRTSLSLSSVSISQNGMTPKPPLRQYSDSGRPSSEVSESHHSARKRHSEPPFDASSNVSSSHERRSKPRQRSPVKSYVTHLTADD